MATTTISKIVIQGSSPCGDATNMSSIKKVWLTEAGADLFSITFESAQPQDSHMRIKAREILFPANPTPEHPLRHTLNLGLLDVDDLGMLFNALGTFLYK